MAARPKYLSLADVADQYSVSVKTLRRWISAGVLPAYRVGDQVRVTEADAETLARPIRAVSGAR